MRRLKVGCSLTRLVFHQKFHGNIWERKSHTEILSGLTYFTMPALIKLPCTESVKGTSLLSSSSAQPVEKSELKKIKLNQKYNQGHRFKILPWFLYWISNFRFQGQQDCLYTHQLQVSLFSHVALVAFIKTTTRALVFPCCTSCIHATTTRALVLPCCTGCIHATTTRALVLPRCTGCSHTTMTSAHVHSCCTTCTQQRQVPFFFRVALAAVTQQRQVPWLVLPCCTGCSRTTTTSALACSPVLHWLQSHNNDKCPGLFARVALAAVTQQRQVPWLVLPCCTGCSHTTTTSALACSPVLHWLQSHNNDKCPGLFARVALAAVTQQAPLFSRVALAAVTQQRQVPWLVLPCCTGCSHTTTTSALACSPVLHWLQSHNKRPCSPVLHWLQSHNRCPCSPVLHWLQSHNKWPCSPVLHCLHSHNNDRCPCSPMLHAPFLYWAQQFSAHVALKKKLKKSKSLRDAIRPAATLDDVLNIQSR